MHIRFSYETKYGTFTDALNLPEDRTYTDQEIEDMKQQRVNNWIAYIEDTKMYASLYEETPAETTP